MCEGYNNKDGSRPIWLEFRSSKWLIGWTAAVAAFTVCDLLILYIFFVSNYVWGVADMLMSLSIGWLYLFIRMFLLSDNDELWGLLADSELYSK